MEYLVEQMNRSLGRSDEHTWISPNGLHAFQYFDAIVPFTTNPPRKERVELIGSFLS